MGVKTITVASCDTCTATIASLQDGFVLRGAILDPAKPDGPPLLGDKGQRQSGAEDAATCWKCFHAKVEDPQLEAERRRAREAQQRARDAERRADNHYDYSGSDRDKPGGGPTGPLPPPELRYVRFARALCGARR